MSFQILNQKFINSIYNSYMLIVPKNASIWKQYIIGKYKNWSFLNDFFFRISLRQVFTLLIETAKKKQQILFIFDKDIYSYYQDLFTQKKAQHFAIADPQRAYHFLEKSPASYHVGLLVYVGNFNNLPIRNIQRYPAPFIFISPSTKTPVDYLFYSQLDYMYPALVLKEILKQVFAIKIPKPIKRIKRKNATKKKTIQKTTYSKRSSSQKYTNIKL